MQLEFEHLGVHATFLELDILAEDNIFIYKLFDNFPFSIVRMPDLTGNIPSTMFYGSIMSEFLRIARCTLLSKDFVPHAKSLFDQVMNQGGTKNKVLRQIRKAMLRHPKPFKTFQTRSDGIISQITG